MSFSHVLYLGLDEVGYTTLKTAINTYKAENDKPDLEDNDIYSGVKWKFLKQFIRVYNQDLYDKFSKTPTIASKVWHLFAIYIPETISVSAAKQWVDDLEAEYPNRVEVVGAWDYKTGLYSGQSYDGEGAVTGTAAYPIHAKAHEFIPDRWNPATEAYDIVPTEFYQVNKLAGQADIIIP